MATVVMGEEASAARTSSRLRITPNRRRIDDRFPFLGFTVTTGGLPFFEVVLATDRALFAPSAAGARTASNYYEGRQDGGLVAAHADPSVYLVPPAVLRGFAQAPQPPAAIFYTVVGYTTPEGVDPIHAREPDELASSAPSVAVARDFTGRTLATVLGVDSERLTRHTAQNVATLGAAEDLAEGEDGSAEPMAAAPVPAAAPAMPMGANDPLHYDDGWGDPPWPPAETLGLAWDAAAPEPGPLLAEEEDEDGGQPYDTALEDLPDYTPLEDAPPAPESDTSGLTIDDKRRLIERVARAESGNARYGAMNLDGEFRGRFGTNHPAHQRYHVGLSFGIVQFTQDSGSLGRLLTMMQARDADMFADVFGAEAADLLAVTNAPGPMSRDTATGRSARVQPVAGADLWEPFWTERFRRAAEHVPFQAAQNELAASDYLEPMLRFCGRMGLDTDRAVTMALDRAVQMGVAGAKQWIAKAAGPVATPALRQSALGALGHADLRGFQASVPGLPADDLWGPETHAAMTAALRALGAASPIPIPSLEQMLDAIVAAAAGEPWADRVRSLRTATDFADRPFAL